MIISERFHALRSCTGEVIVLTNCHNEFIESLHLAWGIQKYHIITIVELYYVHYRCTFCCTFLLVERLS